MSTNKSTPTENDYILKNGNTLNINNMQKYKHMKLTLLIKKGKSGYLIGQIKEIPDVFTQGLSIEEIKENIVDALEMYLEDFGEQYHPFLHNR